jgi:hypothetical protein
MRRAASLSGLAGLLLLLGCEGPHASLEGTVTYEGYPVQHGFITFHPADPRGQPAGAEIRGGFYEIPDLKPGARRVLISSEPEAVLEAGTAQERAHVRLLPPRNAVPRNAVGNNETVEIRPGAQVLDFSLKPPAASPPPSKTP